MSENRNKDDQLVVDLKEQDPADEIVVTVAEARTLHEIFGEHHEHLHEAFTPEELATLKEGELLETNQRLELQKREQSFKERSEADTYFKTKAPANVVEGITMTEYNVIKGAVMGSLLAVSAPFVCAVEDAQKGETTYEQIEGGVLGFGRGIARGIIGGTALVLTGAVTGGNQFFEGVVNASDCPGQGRGLEGNWKHVVNSRYLNLVTNEPPKNFKEELLALQNENKLPRIKKDCNDVEVEYTYQFFFDRRTSRLY